MKYHITLKQPTLLLNRWQRMHWSARRRYTTELAWRVRAGADQGPPATPLARCHVTVERRSVQLPDWDGLYGGLKPLLDCLVERSQRNPHGLGWIVDDAPTCILSLTAMPVRVSRRVEAGTLVVIAGFE